MEPLLASHKIINSAEILLTIRTPWFFNSLSTCSLKRPAGIEMVKQIAFVRLVPADFHRRNGADVQAVNQWRSQQSFDQFFILGDCRNHQSFAQPFGDFSLIDFDDAGKGKEKFLVRKRMV